MKYICFSHHWTPNISLRHPSSQHGGTGIAQWLERRTRDWNPLFPAPSSKLCCHTTGHATGLRKLSANSGPPGTRSNGSKLRFPAPSSKLCCHTTGHATRVSENCQLTVVLRVHAPTVQASLSGTFFQTLLLLVTLLKGALLISSHLSTENVPLSPTLSQRPL